jgi:HEAT repeat protein
MDLFEKLFGLPNVEALKEQRDINRLLQALRHDDDYVRLAAVHALGALGDPRAVEPICGLIGDVAIAIRLAAIHTLGVLGDQRAGRSVCAALLDKHLSVRLAAVRALGALKDRRATGPLCRATRDVTISVRLAATQALGELNDMRAVGPLCDLLTDWNAEIREAALRALGAIKSPRSVESLCAALKDEVPNVRAAAVWALGELKDPRSSRSLSTLLSDPDPKQRVAAIRLLGELKAPDGVESLCAALRDFDIDVRSVAAAALGQIKDPHAIAPLIEALSTQRFHVEVLRWALQRRNTGLRKVAALALGEETRLAPVDGDLLRTALSDSDPGVRDAATAALEQLGTKIGRVRTDPVEQQRLKECLSALATVDVKRWALLTSANYGPMTPGGETLMEQLFCDPDAAIQFVVCEKPGLCMHWFTTSDVVVIEYNEPNGRLHARYVILKSGRPEQYLCYLAWLMVRARGYETMQLQAASHNDDDSRAPSPDP